MLQPGYNPHLQDNFGRNFLARSNGMVSEEVNKAGTWQLINIMSRISDVVDSGIAVQVIARPGLYTCIFVIFKYDNCFEAINTIFVLDGKRTQIHEITRRRCQFFG